ncbi:MAG: TonB-dependent receptor [Pseudomonadota bacterium]
MRFTKRPTGQTFGRLMSGVALSAIATGSAFAQSITDEIIVTSQRTEQSLQDVPIAVSAFGGGELDARQIESFTDIQFNIPNFSLSRNNFTGVSIALRGVGELAVASSSEPSVSIHINDVFITAPRLFETEFYDIERIEVLRGPQGTLFGRNATGGVLNVITNKASVDGVSASVDAEYGNFESVKLRGHLNVPITDTFAARLAGTIIQREGFTENTFTGSDIDDRNIYSFRGTARWLPTDNTTVDVTASYFNEQDNRQRASSSALCNTDPALGCAPGPLSFGGLGPDARASTLGTASTDALALAGLQAGLPLPVANANAELFGLFNIADGPLFGQFEQSTDPRVVALDIDPQNDVEETIVLLNIKHDFETISLKINAGWGNVKYSNIQDFDGGVGTPLTLNPNLATGFAAGELGFGSPEVGGVPILANEFFTGGTIPSSGFDIDGLTGSIGGNILARSNFFQSASRSFSENDYVNFEAIATSSFDSRYNFLLGFNFFRSNGFADFIVSSNSLDYAAAAAGTIFARGEAYSAAIENGATPAEALAASNAVDGGVAFTPFFFNDTDDNFTESYSVFGEIYIDITDTLKFTGGIRRNFDTKGLRDRGNFLDSLGIATVPVGTENVRDLLDADELTEGTPGAINDFRIVEDTFNATTGRAVLEWAASDTVNFYASYTRGFKAGGFNPRPSLGLEEGISLTYDSENINAFEAGMKGNFFENKLQANLTGFYYDYSGLQIANFVNQTTVNENVDATVWGLEAEFVARPMDDLVLNMNASYLNTEIGEFSTINSSNPAANVDGAVVLADISNAQNCVLQNSGAEFNLIGADLTTISPLFGLISAFTDDEFTVCSQLAGFLDGTNELLPGLSINEQVSNFLGEDVNFTLAQTGLPTDVTGNELPGSSDFQISGGVQYTIRLANGAEITPRTDLYYQTESFATIFNEAQDVIPGYFLGNAQITYTPEEKEWFVRLFVQNFTDNDAITGVSNFGQTAGLFYNVFLVEPRRYGVGAGFNF